MKRSKLPIIGALIIAALGVWLIVTSTLYTQQWWLGNGLCLLSAVCGGLFIALLIIKMR